MKPLKLTMQAFGPYSKTAEVDFDRMTHGGLFLIHGPTGAGKTSILDGLSFALFGSSSGADRAAENLRSDLAKPDLATEVSLEFALGRDVYKIIRAPKQFIKKKRGDGLKEEKPKADLYRKNGDAWDLATSGVEDVSEVIEELLGMTADQFRQVILLPQGQFRRFLSSSSKEREQLLETLFRTEKFRKLADQLALKEKTLANEISTARQIFQTQLSSLDVVDLESLQTRSAELATRSQELASGTDALEAKFKEASLRQERARSAARLLQEKSVNEQKRSALVVKQPLVQEMITKIEAEKKSRPVLIVDRELTALQKEVSALTVSLSSEEARFKLAEETLKKTTASKLSLDQRTPEIELLKVDYQAMGDYWKRAKALKDEEDRAPKLKLAFSEAQTRLDSALADLEKVKRERAESETRVGSLTQLAAKAEALRAEIKLRSNELANFKSEIQKASVVSMRVQSIAPDLQKALSLADAASTELKKAKLQFHLSQAAMLAAELSPNEPCPVCGSKEHPKLASTSSESTGADDLYDLEKKEAQAREALIKLQTQYTSAREELTALEKSLVESQARERVNELTQEIAKLEEELKAAQKDLVALSEVKKSLEALTLKLATAEASIIQLTGKRDDARVALQDVTLKIEQLLTLVPEEWRDLESIKAKGQALKTKLDEFAQELKSVTETHEKALQESAGAKEKLAALNEQLITKSRAVANSEVELAKELSNSGFQTIEACRLAGLSPQELQRLENERRSFENEFAVVTARLAEIESEVSSLPEWALDLASREAEYKLVDRKRTEALTEIHSIKEKARTLQDAHARLAKENESLIIKEDRYKVLGKLAGVALGQPPYNLSRVNFPRFVLSARLDEVLEQASRRLYQMSRGQFVIRRAQAQDDKRKAAGLELEIEDAFSGTARPTASLSGGEGFMASLCLALGLADVVQSSLGGIRLDAVFVDEGFGSLDNETLDLAMKTLTELTGTHGSRLVGIISHVTELKDQITNRLLVHKSQEGSSVLWEH